MCLGRFFVDKCFKHYHEDAEIWNMIILHDFPFGVMSGFQLFVFEVIFRSISLTLRKHTWDKVISLGSETTGIPRYFGRLFSK